MATQGISGAAGGSEEWLRRPGKCRALGLIFCLLLGASLTHGAADFSLPTLVEAEDEPVEAVAPKPGAAEYDDARRREATAKSAEELASIVAAYERAAEAGNVSAMVRLGRVRLRGLLGQAVDKAAARKWYERAAREGSIAARVGLARTAKAEGHPIPEVISLLENAVERGSRVAMCDLGALYEHGDGVARNPKQAFEWYEKAAQRDFGWAQMKVGFLLLDGPGVPADPERACELLKLAAEKGFAQAEARLAICFLTGTGVPGNIRHAFVHIVSAGRRLNELGLIQGLAEVLRHATTEERTELGRLMRRYASEPSFLETKGVLPEMCLVAWASKLEGLDEPEVARELFARLATQERPQSLLTLAEAAYVGWPCPYDLEKARRWAQRAVTEHPHDGPAMLASIDAAAGETPAERERALWRLRDLAAVGNRRALLFLGTDAVHGIFGERDPAAAVEYLSATTSPHGQKATLTFEDVCRTFQYTPPEPPDPAALAAAIAKARAMKTEFPIPVHREAPAFPLPLRVSGLQGQADIEFLVDTEGRTAKVTAVSADHPLFARAGEAAVRRWRFVPGNKNGKPVVTRMQVPVIFNLDDEPAASADKPPR